MGTTKLARSGVLIASLWFGACGPPKPLFMDLGYAPTSTFQTGTLPGHLTETPLEIGEISLQTERPEGQLGSYDDDGNAVPVHASPESMIDSIRRGLETNLRAAGLQIQPGSNAVLKVTILDLWVDEAHTYKGVLRLKVDVLRDGAASGSVVVMGTATRWGSTLEADNYREVISDALVEATQNLLQSTEFQEAFPGSGGPNE